MRIRRSVLLVTQQTTKELFEKTTIAILSVALMACGAVVGQNILTTPRMSYAATPPDSCFQFNAGTGVITSYYTNENGISTNPACPTSVDIPATIGGVAVTSIGDSAFYSKNISSVTIPSSVTSLGSYAFYYNQLSSVTIPSSVTSLGDYAFTGNQLASVTIPSSITHMGLLVFARNDLTSITIPESLTTISTGAFRDNKITSVTIPASVTNIGAGAFYDNSISTLAIPDTVTSLGNFAFATNQLASLDIGCGVSSIGSQVFAANKLQEVTVPDCITSVDPTAFFGQNPWGGVIDASTDPAHDWFSSDPAVLKAVYDNIWYVRLYTSDPSNPNHLIDGITNEDWYTGDLNSDGNGSDSIGGHLINPASVSVRCVDGTNASLSPNYSSTGHLTDGTNLSDYLVKNVLVPPIAHAQTPTTSEQAALETALGAYSRIGQNMLLTAPTIAGYTLQHPGSPYTESLIGKINAIDFTYATTQTVAGSPIPSPPATNPPSSSTSSGPTIQPKPSAQPTQAATITNESANNPAPVADEARIKVDFTAPAGSASNPTTGAVPDELAPIMAKSSLAVDDKKPCHQIDSAKLLSATSFTVPDTSYKTLGGLAFVLNCAAVGGDAAVTFTLGDTIPDATRIKIYKENSHGLKTDITNLVGFSNDGTHTTIRYTLQDGQSLDDDGVANSSISDPIYIALPNTTAAAAKPSATSQTPWSTIALIAGTVVAVLAITVAIVVNKRCQV